jgi:multimeric flavodoxin WrbA
MKIEYFHASVYGNGAMVAEEFKRQMATKGVTVEVHHIEDVKPRELAQADLYVFSSPGRFGKPIKEMRRFLADTNLPAGTRCAILTTEPAPKPDKKTGKVPTEEELDAINHVMSGMNEVLKEKGLLKVAGTKVFVTSMKGPLEAGWQKKVESFANTILG